MPGVLPKSGRVLGIDVGYSPTRRTTAFCCLSWTQDRIDWSESLATAARTSREEALRIVRGSDQSPFLSLAIDGPLRPDLQLLRKYRTAECLLSRGNFQKRGKPGPTNGGSGPKLHGHATCLARMVVEHREVEPAKMPFSASSSGVYEAFPNLFLGVLCDEGDYPVRPSRGRFWTDSLFPLVASRLDKLIVALLPQRNFESVAKQKGHEPIAALVCAITALAAAAGECVAVGAPADGYMVLPPIGLWGASANKESWAKRELRQNVGRLSAEKTGVYSPRIYSGENLLDLNRD